MITTIRNLIAVYFFFNSTFALSATYTTSFDFRKEIHPETLEWITYVFPELNYYLNKNGLGEVAKALYEKIPAQLKVHIPKDNENETSEDSHSRLLTAVTKSGFALAFINSKYHKYAELEEVATPPTQEQATAIFAQHAFFLSLGAATQRKLEDECDFLVSIVKIHFLIKRLANKINRNTHLFLMRTVEHPKDGEPILPDPPNMEPSPARVSLKPIPGENGSYWMDGACCTEPANDAWPYRYLRWGKLPSDFDYAKLDQEDEYTISCFDKIPNKLKPARSTP